MLVKDGGGDLSAVFAELMSRRNNTVTTLRRPAQFAGVHVCVRACVRACARARACVCVCV